MITTTNGDYRPGWSFADERGANFQSFDAVGKFNFLAAAEPAEAHYNVTTNNGASAGDNDRSDLARG